MAWSLRVVELGRGLWECRWGQRAFGTAPDVETALRLARALAESAQREGDFVCYVHRLDGSVAGPEAVC